MAANVTGTPLLTFAFRTECCGYLGALYALRALLTYHNHLEIETPISGQSHIDNKALVLRSSQCSARSVQACPLPDWDILHTTQVVLVSIPVQLVAVHVKSHQDSGPTPSYSKVSLPAKLNIQADQLTHLAYTQCQPTLTLHQLPEVHASLPDCSKPTSRFPSS